MRYLIVVARNQPAVYEHLRHRHGRDPRVQVVVDRRGADDVEMTANPPPVERRRRRSWLTTGASHELVELPADDTTESRSPKQKPGVPHEEATRQMSETQMCEIETVEDPQQVTRWLTESQQMLDRVIPALIEERDRLRQSLEARDRECEQLRGERDETRRNLGKLQSELERLRGERAAMVKAFDDVVAVLAQLHGPMYEIARRLDVRPTPWAGVDAPRPNGGP